MYISVFFYAKKNWQLAIFAYTIFAVKVLNFSVRYGKRWDPAAKATANIT